LFIHFVSYFYCILVTNNFSYNFFLSNTTKVFFKSIFRRPFISTLCIHSQNFLPIQLTCPLYNTYQAIYPINRHNFNLHSSLILWRQFFVISFNYVKNFTSVYQNVVIFWRFYIFLFMYLLILLFACWNWNISCECVLIE